MAKTPDLTNEEWLQALRDAHAIRATFYYRIFCEMRDELGEEKALDLIGRACRKMGLAKREKMKPLMADDTAATFCSVFVSRSDVGAKIFEMETGEVTGDGADQQAVVCLNRCALVDGWHTLGVADEDIAKLCRAAREVDYGKLECLGFEGDFATLIAEGGPCCRLEVRKRRQG